jgi:hypothetical protein
MEHLTLIDGRLCLSKKTKLNKLKFTWQDDYEAMGMGRAKITRIKPSHNKVIKMLTKIYEKGITDLPDTIGKSAPGCSTASIYFCCKLDSGLFKKEIDFFSFNADKQLKDKFYLLKNIIDTKLCLLTNPWWKIWNFCLIRNYLTMQN